MTAGPADGYARAGPPVDHRLRALCDKAARAPGATFADFDWRQPPRRPLLLPRRTYLKAVSQLYHGELAAAQLCAQVSGGLQETDANRFLALQSADEAGHAEIYRRYLDALGGVAPADAAFARAVAAVLAWPGAPEAQLLACHVLLEGEALRVDHWLARWSPCPLLRQISLRLARDEARHIAFGKLYLRAALPRLGLAERLAIYRWLRGLWDETAMGAFDGFLSRLPGLGRRRQFAADRWSRHAEALGAAGLFDDGEAHHFFLA